MDVTPGSRSCETYIERCALRRLFDDSNEPAPFVDIRMIGGDIRSIASKPLLPRLKVIVKALSPRHGSPLKEARPEGRAISLEVFEQTDNALALHKRCTEQNVILHVDAELCVVPNADANRQAVVVHNALRHSGIRRKPRVCASRESKAARHHRNSA